MSSDWKDFRTRSKTYDGTTERAPLVQKTPKKSTLWRAISQDSFYESFANKYMEDPKAEGWAEVTRQSSVVTIFAIWNTMMGTSLLAIPWGIQRAGVVMGPLLTLVMGGLCLYTAYCNVRAHSQYGTPAGDISELTRTLLGPQFEVIAKIFSLIVLLGANIVYWILMSNFLYHSVNYVNGITEDTVFDTSGSFNESLAGVFCPASIPIHNTPPTEATTFRAIWNMDTTVPIFLTIIIAPLLNFKSPTFFTKFNSLGTLSVAYLIAFVVLKSSFWGVNLNLTDTESIHYTPPIQESFLATSGMLALSYFIHNIIITVVRSNADQKNNGRDLSIAYSLVTTTYLIIGGLFYMAFPLAKSCIQDNFLNNFASWDVMTVVARVFLLFQLVTVFPLISYMLRVQTMVALTGNPYPGRGHVILFNSVVVLICILFAVFLPKIGTIIRFTGAISGLVHVFTLPCLLRLATLYRSGKVSPVKWFLLSIIPIFGAANLIGQFFVSDSN